MFIRYKVKPTVLELCHLAAQQPLYSDLCLDVQSISSHSHPDNKYAALLSKLLHVFPL
jgi:hypothetical protein